MAQTHADPSLSGLAAGLQRVCRAATASLGLLGAVVHLITGDSLFPGGPGNTEKDPQRFGSLMDDLEARVFGVYGDSTWVYPGHGKDTTLGTERPSVPEWRSRGW